MTISYMDFSIVSKKKLLNTKAFQIVKFTVDTEFSVNQHEKNFKFTRDDTS